jgi:two-component sensor histidine kinase
MRLGYVIRLIGIATFITVAAGAFGQEAPVELNIKSFPETVNPYHFLDSIRYKSDTGKVNAYINVSSLLWRLRSPDNPQLDSALYFARQALVQSRQCKYLAGFTESAFLVCKLSMEMGDSTAAMAILAQTTGQERIRLLLVISEHYIFSETPTSEAIIDRALPFLKEALALAEKEGSTPWIVETKVALGKYYFTKGMIAPGKSYFLQVIDLYKHSGDIAKEARWWAELARYIPDSDSTHLDELRYFDKAIDLELSLNDKVEAANVLGDEAYAVAYVKDFNYAEKLYLRKIALLKEAGKNKFYTSYLPLADISQENGNLGQALAYTLLALKNIEELHHDAELPEIYRSLGNLYRALNDTGQSIQYFQLCLASPWSMGFKLDFEYTILRSYTGLLIEQGNARQALAFATTYFEKNPPMMRTEPEIKAAILGDCYDGLGRYKEAEENYLEMINLDAYHDKIVQAGQDIAGSEAYYTIAKFYVDHGNFTKADPLLKHALAFSMIPPALERDIRLLRFRIDSASASYPSAIQNYQRSVFLSDSLANASHLKEMGFLKVQFETSQKEKDIKLLENESKLQKQELEKSSQLKVFSFVGAGMLLMIVFILYNRNRLKQKKNLLLERQKEILERQKEIIDHNNNSLKRLVEEKEWLLNEVHHRVKNNLQTVTSLLTTQMVSAGPGPVADAIMESRHRVQAMAMIHQRLYNQTNIRSILMPDYVAELVHYLKSAFQPGPRIIFSLRIEPISFDIGVAMPLALILNEAISNSLKHAFPDGREGLIEVSLSNTSGVEMILVVRDDGIGFSSGTIENSKSFGLTLIYGLASDLSGEVRIDSHQGTRVKIWFELPNELR